MKLYNKYLIKIVFNFLQIYIWEASERDGEGKSLPQQLQIQATNRGHNTARHLQELYNEG